MHDCYWFIDKEKTENQTMEAICQECHNTNPFGWFWPGSKRGYGNYDLSCAICGKVLNIKNEDKEEDTTTV